VEKNNKKCSFAWSSGTIYPVLGVQINDVYVICIVDELKTPLSTD
jgi:hypothetical protein